MNTVPLKQTSIYTRTGRGRFGTVAGLLGPAGILILLPKCPLCIVAYAAAFTGVSLTVGMASGMRYTVISFSLAAILFFAYRFLIGRKAKKGRDVSAIHKTLDY